MKLTSLSTIAALAAFPFLMTACDDGADTGDDAADDSAQEAGADDDAADDDAADDDAADDDGAGDAGDAGDDAVEGDAGDDAVEGDAGDDAVEGDAGDDAVEGDAGDDAVEGDAGDDAVEGDAGDDAAEGDAGGGEGGEETKFGTISLTQMTGVGLASASFVISTPGSGGGGDNPCETETVDACIVVVCATGGEAGEGGVAGESRLVGAGDVSITGLDADLALTFTEEPASYSENVLGSLWSESTEATVEATGSDDVPAFSLALTLPDVVTFTAPVANELLGYDASRADGLEFSWDGGGVGQVNVSLIGSTDDESISITCTGASADGSLTVDASLLEALPDEVILNTSIGANAFGTAGDDWTIVFNGTVSGPAGSLALTD